MDQVCKSEKKKRKPQAQVSTQYNKFKKTKYNQSTKSEISVPILGKVELHVIVKINMYMQK